MQCVRRLAMCTVLLLASAVVLAQDAMYTGRTYPSLTNAGAPATGAAYHLSPIAGFFTWQVVPSGTISTLTVNLEGSVDGTNWFTLSQIKHTDVEWNAYGPGEMQHVVNKGLVYIRCSLVAISGGGTISATIARFQ